MNFIDPSRLVFIDESGCNTALSRTHAWAPIGTRAVARAPGATWKTLTVVGAIRRSKWLTYSRYLGGTTGKRFLSFVRERLAPKLRRGDVVVLDNLRAHKVAGVEQAIREVGAHVIYLPPYSPDLNPIEPAWSKVKSRLRAISARTIRDLRGAVHSAISSVTQRDLRNWFKHCGYSPLRTRFN